MRRYLAILLTLAVLPISGGAQEAPPWDAFLGCWVNTEMPERQQQLCYVPTAGSVSAAEMVVLVADSVVSRTRVDARGTRQPVRVEACDGFEVTQRSADGLRLYTRGEVRCGTVRQLTSSLLTLSPRGDLVRISAVMVGEQQAVVTERLAPVAVSNVPSAVRGALESVQMRVRGARVATMRLLDVAQVEAALQETDAVVLEAWMVEATRDTTGFRAPRRALERLAAAGAPVGVIDMAVMLGNPKYFDIHNMTERRRPAFNGGANWTSMNRGFCSMHAPTMWTPEMAYYWHAWGPSAFMNPWFLHNGCDPSDFMGFGFRVLAWDPFAWWQFGVNRWDPFYGRGVVVTPVSGGSLSRSIPLGRVEKGRGYAPSNTSGGGGAVPRGDAVEVRQPASTGSANAGAGASSASGGGSGGPQRTESGSSTGRTAQPRPPRERP